MPPCAARISASFGWGLISVEVVRLAAQVDHDLVLGCRFAGPTRIAAAAASGWRACFAFLGWVRISLMQFSSSFPPAMTIRSLLTADLLLDWAGQKAVLGFN